MWTKICSPKCEGRQSAFTFLGAIFRPEDGPFFGGAPPLRVMRAGARACHDDACCSVHMSFARYTFSPRASSVSEGPMMATAPCVARSRGASSCALCEDLGYMQCAASLPPQQSVFRRDAVAGHAAVPRGMCGLGQRGMTKCTATNLTTEKMVRPKKVRASKWMCSSDCQWSFSCSSARHSLIVMIIGNHFRLFHSCYFAKLVIIHGPSSGERRYQD